MTRKTAMASHHPPRTFNVASSEQDMLDEIKQAYVDDVIGLEQMEEDIQHVLEGGFFAGTYRNHIVPTTATEGR